MISGKANTPAGSMVIVVCFVGYFSSSGGYRAGFTEFCPASILPYGMYVKSAVGENESGS
jgi:hypothetical protein